MLLIIFAKRTIVKFKTGDKVSFLNEKGSGVITNILSNFRVLVLNEDGFEISISVDEIVLLADKSEYKMDATIKKKWIDEKEEEEVHPVGQEPMSHGVKPPKLSHNEAWEVDLHLHEVLDTGREITDHEKLLAQLKYFRRCMDAAIAHGIKKIIFIHGVGKGTLRHEIIHALKNYERIRQYNAPYKKYGFGALIVEFY